MEINDHGLGAERVRRRLDPPPPAPLWLVEFRRARRGLKPELREVLQAFARGGCPRGTAEALGIWMRRTGESERTFYRRLERLRAAFQLAKKLHDG